MCQQCEQYRAEHTALGGAGVQCDAVGCSLSYSHWLWSACKKVQYPLAEWCVEALSVQLLCELLWNDGVKCGAKINILTYDMHIDGNPDSEAEGFWYAAWPASQSISWWWGWKLWGGSHSSIVADLRHSGTTDWSRDELKMSAKTSLSWSAQSLRTCPGMFFSGPAALQGLGLLLIIRNKFF